MNWALLEREDPQSFPGAKTKNGMPTKQKRM
jgi:hypothetical protein